MPTTVSTPNMNGVHGRKRTFGWLLKKSHTFPVSIYDYCFVTIDYDAKILSYSRDQRESIVLKAIQFSEILGVEPFPMQQENDEEERIRRSSWKSSRAQAEAKKRAKVLSGVSGSTSWGSCLPMLGKDVQKCGFILQTAANCMEFVCTSHRQVEDWIAAIGAAMSLCSDDAVKAHISEVESEQSTRSHSTSSSESEPSDTEMTEVDDNLPAPVFKVPLSNVMKPGRCFSTGSSLGVGDPFEFTELDFQARNRSADRDSDPRTCNDAGSMDSTTGEDTRKVTKRKVHFGPLPDSKSIPLRERLLVCGKGPLPRNIKIP